ncbi:MAG: glycosyltransferase family 4 protein [Aromatoleum sp.]|nr:glycosyltransferase family 4 protein [Aromatoleum sp.]
MKHRHALFVAFHVPPEASSSGVLRTLKYIRYLDELGWRVTVVCPDVEAYAITDSALESQFPRSCRVVRTRFLNTKRHLSLFRRYPALLAVPDAWVGWLPWGVAAGARTFASDPFDLVYSTSPHATAHLIAWRIAKRTRRPWVADFRDPWFEDDPEPGAPSGPVFRGIDRWLERRVIESCQAVVTSTTSLRDTLRARYRREAPEKFTAIFNGYDEADFASLPVETRSDTDLVVLHAGIVNGEFRDPRPLFVAVRRCADEGLIAIDRLRIRFLGGGSFGESTEVTAAVRQLGLDRIVEFLPRVPYAESLRELAGADVLLLLQSSPDTTGLVPAKLYEYLRAQKPVVALVQSGATGEILGMVRGGWTADPDDANALHAVMAEVFARWRAGTLRDEKADLSLLRRFDRKALTAELALLFDRLHAGRTNE